VAFIDGKAFFGLPNLADCTVDSWHPNDLGFMRMAEWFTPLCIG
jgi:hypothetical protein